MERSSLINTFAVAMLSVGISVVAQFFLKAGMSGPQAKALMSQPISVGSIVGALSDARVLIGFFLYAIGAVAWLVVLSKWDVSKAFPMAGLGFALSLVVGTLTGEQITTVRVFGVVVICAGVCLVART